MLKEKKMLGFCSEGEYFYFVLPPAYIWVPDNGMEIEYYCTSSNTDHKHTIPETPKELLHTRQTILQKIPWTVQKYNMTQKVFNTLQLRVGSEFFELLYQGKLLVREQSMEMVITKIFAFRYMKLIFFINRYM